MFRRLAIVAATLAIAACSGPTPTSSPAVTLQPSSEAPSPTPQETTSPTAASEEPSPATTSPTTPSESPSQAAQHVVLGVIELAEAEGTAYSIDWSDDGYWEVGVLASGGGREINITPDGAILSSQPDDLDADEAKALAEAQIPLSEAVVLALGEDLDVLDQAELDEDDGVWTWQVETRDDRDIHVDPASGEVRRG